LLAENGVGQIWLVGDDDPGQPIGYAMSVELSTESDVRDCIVDESLLGLAALATVANGCCARWWPRRRALPYRFGWP
jgi:hypothetical protein